MQLICLGLLTMGYNGRITTCSYSDKRYSVNKNEVKKMNITKNFKIENCHFWNIFLSNDFGVLLIFLIFIEFSRFFGIFQAQEQDPPKKCSVSELRQSWMNCRGSILPAIYHYNHENAPGWFPDTSRTKVRFCFIERDNQKVQLLLSVLIYER